MEVVDKTEKSLPALSAGPRNFTAGGHMFIYRGRVPLKGGTVADRWTSADGALEAMSRTREGRLEVTLFQKYKFPRPEIGISVAAEFFGGVAHAATLRREGALCGYRVVQSASDGEV